MDAADVEARAERALALWEAIEREVGKVIVGQAEVLEQTLIALFAGGHALLEGVPGLGKTLLVKTVARVLDLEFHRIQFTPDLMPADITGTNVLVEDKDGRRRFAFEKGPVFSHILLADEINRATPKTQSALLEAMEERTVTVARTLHRLAEPFFVLATQNPLEMEGTYPLPEAQVDRFLFKLDIAAPVHDDLVEVLRRTTGAGSPAPQQVGGAAAVLAARALVREVAIAGPVLERIARIVLASSPHNPAAPDLVRRYVRFGASPRGAQAIALAAKARALRHGRLHAAPEDVDRVIHPALRHRIILTFEGEAEGIAPERILDAVIGAV